MAAARFRPSLPATKNAIGVPIRKLGKTPIKAPSANPNPVFAGVEFSRTMRINCRRTQRAKRRERRNVAVHAEDGVRRDDLALRGQGGNPARERVDVAVRIADEFRPREECPVVEARVVEAVCEDRIGASGQRRKNGQVGEVTR